MRVVPGNAQHIGDRQRQEDAFGFSNLGDRAFESHGGIMMVLCDGMGGLANGAVASRAAVDAILSGYSRKQPSEDIPSALDRVLLEAQEAVCATFGDGGTSGSTVVVAVVWQDQLYWASLGDSRLYLCRKGAPAAQLTVDHNVASLLEQRLAQGLCSDMETISTTNAEALTAYLGAPHPPQPHMGREVSLRPGDRIVACSDGLYRGLSPEAMAATARHGHPMKAADQMIRAVLKQKLPQQDNLTVVLFEMASHPPLMENIRRRLIETVALPGPTIRGALLYGALGGFVAAVAVAAILIVLGVLGFPQHQQQRDVSATSGTAPPVQPETGQQSAAGVGAKPTPAGDTG